MIFLRLQDSLGLSQSDFLVQKSGKKMSFVQNSNEIVFLDGGNVIISVISVTFPRICISTDSHFQVYKDHCDPVSYFSSLLRNRRRKALTGLTCR